MTTRIQELLRGCVVRLAAPGTAGGTGFFVAPGTIVTCAHVVAGAVGPVTASLAGRDVPAEVVAVHPDEPGSPYPFPDLALLRVDETGHPCVLLDTADPRWDDRMHCAGYTRTWPGDEPTPEPELFTFVGVHHVDGPYLKLSGGQAVPGMSGGPLVNLRTMAVCGILKTTRHADAPYGGWGIPLAPLRELHPEVIAEADAFHRADRRWREATDPIDPLLAGLSAVGADYVSRIENFLVEYLGRPGHPTPFGGRDAQLAELTTWLRSPDATPYALVAAEAGRGKSALLVRWSQDVLRQGLADVIVIPVSLRFNTGHASVVFPALATRLAKVYGEPPTSTELSAEQWKEVCAGYLRRPPPSGRPLLVVVDGLDEATDWRPGPDLFPAVPAPGVRVLASARYLAGDVAAEGWLARLNWPPPLATAMALPPMDRDGVAQVLVEMGDPLVHLASVVDVVSELYRLSEGDPLLVRLYVEALLPYGERAAAISPDELPTIDRGLGGYFERWWLEQERLWDQQGRNSREERRNLQDVLNALSSSLGPLSLDDLAELLPDLPGLTLGSLTREVGRFVIGDGRATGFVFSHPRLAMFFLDAMSARERRAWEERFLDYGRQTLERVRGGETDVPSYPIRFHGAHLEAAAAPDEELYALLDRTWLRAWEALEGGDSGFLNDSERAWRRAETGADARSFEVRLLCALIRSSVAARSENIPPRLLVESVVAGVITPAQAVALCRRISDEDRRARAVIRLAPALPVEWSGEFVAIAGSMTRGTITAHVLTNIAAHLDERSVRRALSVVRALAADQPRLLPLAALSARLPQEEGDAVTGEIMATLPAHLASLRNDAARGRSLTALADRVAPERLPELAALADRVEDPRAAVRALCAIARRLPPPEREELVGRAVHRAEVVHRELPKPWALAQVDLALAELLPEMRVPALEALETVARWGERVDRQLFAARSWLGTIERRDWPALLLSSLRWSTGHLMEELAPCLPADIRAWLSDPDSAAPGGLWAGPQSPPEGPEVRAWSLAAEGPAAAPGLVAAALRDAGELCPAQRAPTLTALALCHTGEDRRRLLTEALTGAQQIDDLPARLATLPTVMDDLDSPERAAAQKLLFKARTGGPLAHVLNVGPIEPDAVDSALAAARDAPEPLDRAQALIVLMAGVPADRRAECREPAVTALLELPLQSRLRVLLGRGRGRGATDGIDEVLYDPAALADAGEEYLFRILPNIRHRPELLDRAVERLALLLFAPFGGSHHPSFFLSVWPQLSRQLPQNAVRTLWTAALSATPTVRADVIPLLVPRLPADLLEDAVDAALRDARAPADAETLADGLAAVYAGLPAEPRLRLLDAALGPKAHLARLQQIAAHVAPEQRRTVIDRVAELIPADQAALYPTLVRTYPEELTRPVLTTVLEAEPSTIPTQTLAELCAHVDAETAEALQNEILESVQHCDIATIRRLLRSLPEQLAPEVVRRVMRDRPSQDLSPLIKELPTAALPPLAERIVRLEPPSARLTALGPLVARDGTRMPDSRWRAALEMIEDLAVQGKVGSNEVLAFLRKALPPMDDDRARDFTDAILRCPDPSRCAAALAALAERVSPAARAAVLDRMLDIVDAGPNARHAARVLTEAAAVAAGNDRGTWRTLEAVARLHHDHSRHGALEKLTPAIRKSTASTAAPVPEWDRALRQLSRRSRPTAVMDLVLLVSGGAPLAPRPQDMAAAYFGALRATGEWWP
ncbi:hypothetical protein GCM10022254_54910 [Actinomadura meridiana]|uniref:Trypsin-like peptidase domain-containing protein n=1 Tax=Actinomadura meridiana TaxID=559626 RepID=A0ABP8CFT6_9ACTN